ncbi:Phytochrome-like protein cph1 [Aquisphaera giovannonii]|uniref:histidine kinase n=1 Tax=Aquisphaera giovannonii TaxID=406548 RepID=A0A5B9W9H9_9BACT|nr:PAS domain-containing protein [Aquisphaera giovannonii]QEH37097.1 Phytochrome-like protein cph1 [Aquisphaera giovannonii]
MSRRRSPVRDPGVGRRAAAPFLIAMGWLALVGLMSMHVDRSERVLVLATSSVPLAWTWLVWAWQRPSPEPRPPVAAPAKTEGPPVDSANSPAASFPPARSDVVMTRSGLYTMTVPEDSSSGDLARTGEFAITDMVNRLDPVGFRWLDSSPAEQEFLGWPLGDLRDSSFLKIVHPDDRSRVRESFQQAIERGESLGLVFRIKTARGETRAVELNASARYTPEHQISCLRCHLTDVTEKIRAERELRLRSRELTRLNEQLREINRQLEDLKDRYSELYDGVPAMCFSLDAAGRVIECNETFLSVLRRKRGDILGKGFEAFVHPDERERARRRFAVLQERGTIEAEGRWLLAEGGTIDVWVRGKVVRGVGEAGDRVRCVAEDMTAKHRLEAELRETNRSLALANAELSKKNEDLDEFVYVVSHDLQEPLRTLQVYSDFLLRDHADRIDPQGQQLVHHLSDASRRLHAMVNGLLNTARAGKAAGELSDVSFHDLIEIVKADLSARIRERGAEVIVEGPDVSLRGDRWRLQRLFTNLIGNGIKYNRSESPRIVVGVQGVEGQHPPAADAEAGNTSMVRCFVRDNGIGIDPRNHHKIFHIFRRLHSSDEYEGIGAGLAICSKIVQAHGGLIGLESRLGEGATFFVTLPATPGPSLRGEGETSRPDASRPSPVARAEARTAART